MKTLMQNCHSLFKFLFIILPSALCLQASAQGTAFTYQGRLNQNGAAYTGSAEFLASLWSVPTSGSALASNVTGVVVGVTNGLFTLPLDFGANFSGADRWLELDVRTALGPFTQLAPRQQLTPTPYAVYAEGVNAAGISGAIADAQLSTNIARLNSSNLVFTGQVQFNNTNSAFQGTFTGNGAGITNVTLNTLNSYGAISGGDFTTMPPLPAGSGPGFVITTDVNGDGRPDIVCANSGGTTLSVYTNNGSGGFVLSSSPTVGGAPSWITSVDINGDGKPDLITANYGASGNGNTLTVLTNNGSGGFVLASSPTVGHGPVAIATADFNGDGKIDLASANFTDSTVSILIQISPGVFSLAPPLNLAGRPIAIIATNLFAVDGDTNIDLICVLDSPGADIQIYEGTGGATFTFSGARGSGNTPIFAAMADLNGDTVPELVIADFFGGNLVVYNFIGNTRTTLSVPSGPNSVTITDFNGDGHPDLLTGNLDGTVSVFLNNGSGGFTAAPSLSAGAIPFSVATADFNGDGRADLVTANFNDSNLSLLLSAPHFTGGFTGDGSGLTGLNASNVISGTLADARLSANVALLSADQSFAGQNTFNNLANSFSGNGAGLTALSASNVVSGTLADARLSTNVARLNASQTFSGNNTFTAGQIFNGQIYLNTTNGFNMTSLGNFYIDLPFFGGGRLTILTNGNMGLGTSNPTQKLQVVGGALFTSGTVGANQSVSWTPGSASWTFTSDRATKERFAPVDTESVLEKLSRIPLSEWNYIGFEQRHIGPMAQDFHAQFPLNNDDKTLNDADLHGVALAAIQGLNQKLEARSQKAEDKIQKLEAENSELKQRLEKLEQLISERKATYENRTIDDDK